jgi:hypothetical protein
LAKKFPGLCASPKETAAWCKSVAEEEFGLPGILPVMASAVELTSAWTSEGCLDDIPGYSWAVDHDSLGLWQQRPSQGWGTVAQLSDPEYSLRAFCREADRFHGAYDENDPEELGMWCAAVQRPREDLEYLYAEKGWPIAKALLAEEGASPWKERNFGFDSQGWALDLETNAYLKAEVRDGTLYTNRDGWLYKWDDSVPPEKQWAWPVANAAPRPNSPWYRERYPDRYNWRPDVEEVARYIVDTYGVWCNTYHLHPPEVSPSRERDSLDVWGPGGRGDPLDWDLHETIFWDIFNDGKPPWIEWTISKGWLWSSAGGWRWWSDDLEDDADTFHGKHIHYTFWA